MIKSIPHWDQIQKRPDLLIHASIYLWAARIFKPGWVIDLGSELGIGGELMESANRGIEVLAYDIDLTSLLISAEHNQKLSINRIQGDGAFLPLRSNQLSGLCLVNTLHLAEDPHQVLNECCRVLKPGSQAVISIPVRKLPNRWHIEKLTMTIINLAEELFSDIHVPDHIYNKLTGSKWEVGMDAEYSITICKK